jgi:hypothetical protein
MLHMLTHPRPETRRVHGMPTLSPRKLRLLVCACCRMTGTRDEASLAAVATAEGWADTPGLDTTVLVHARDMMAQALAQERERRAERCRSQGGHRGGDWYEPPMLMELAARSLSRDDELHWDAVLPRWFRHYGSGHHPAWAWLIREVAGDYFTEPAPLPPAALRGEARALAVAAYGERMAGGCLDRARLGILADCLEEGGVGDAALLAHLRGHAGGTMIYLSGAKPCVDIGIIFKYYLHESLALKFDFRHYTVLASDVRNNLALNIGLSFKISGFAEEEKEVRFDD